MARHLLVLDRTDGGPEFMAAARELSRKDPDASFVLLAPATPLGLMESLVAPRCTARAYARERVQRARARLVGEGLRVVATRLGNFDTVQAVEDAARFTQYAVILIETLPPFALTRVVHQDVCSRLARRLPKANVIHVVENDIPPPPIPRDMLVSRTRDSASFGH